MSLHVLANHMASKGRDGDSMLVHMTPGEVHGLQALAMKHGGSLTTNPDTGLPEANFLKSLLPMLAGFALGPAGFGLVSSAMGAGAIVGGITGIATGSLSKGLMAGLGAYGGFGIGESLAGMGASAMGDAAASSAYGASAGMTDVAAQELGFASAEEAAQDAAARAARNFDPSQVAGFDKATAGFNAATSSGSAALDFAKNNKLALGMAAAPIMADMMVPTTTKAAPIQSPGRIVEKRWNGREFVPVASTDANVFNTSGRTFSDPYRGYNNGGIVALANGGVPGYATGGPLVNDQIIFDYFKGLDQSKLKSGALDAQIAADMQKYDVGAADISRATGTQALQGDYEKRFVNAIATPGITAAKFDEYTADVGLTGKNLATALQNSGLSQSAQYALTHRLDDTAGITTAPKTAQDFYNTFGYQAGDLKGDVGGLAGMYTNIKQVAGSLQDQINAGKITAAEARALSQGEMTRLGMSGADVKNATGFDLANLFKDKAVVGDVVCGPGYKKSIDGKSCVPIGVIETFNPPTVPSGYHINSNGVLVPNISSTQNTTTGVDIPTDLYTAPATSLPVGVGGNTGPSQIGGGATVNPNGTITTSPRIPGIPVGGFTGMQNLRDVYTKGGGSLGYTSPKFSSLDEFTEKYVNKRMSGDSKAAYDYLTGKGGAKYPVKSGVGQISEDYATAVLGYPARGNLPYIYNKATGKMDVNPDYIAPGRDAEGNVTYGMSLNDVKKSLTDKPLSGQALYDWAKANNLSAQQIADATGRSLSSVYSDFRAGSKAAADKKAITNDDGTVDEAKVAKQIEDNFDEAAYLKAHPSVAEELRTGKSVSGQPVLFTSGYDHYMKYGKAAGWEPTKKAAGGGIMGYAMGGMPGYALGGLGTLGGYSDGGRLLKGPGDGVSDSIPATIGRKQQPARLADGEFVVPARIVSELGNGSTDAGAKKLYAMMDRVQRARGKTTGKNKVAANSRADKYLPA